MHIWLLTIGLVALDQISKYIVVGKMEPGDSIELISPLLRFTLVYNSGAAFGLFADQTALLVAIGILVLAFVWYFRSQFMRQSIWVRAGLVLAVSGAVGNLIDRVRLGAVIDFIHLPFWPIFNAADIMIVLGIGMLFWEVLHDGSDRQNQEIRDRTR